MNDEDLNQLLADARAAGPHDTSRMAFGFETRLAARIAADQPREALGIWPWRLLPVFGALALCVSWDIWHSAADRELQIRSGLERSNVEWAYVEAITGRTL